MCKEQKAIQFQSARVPKGAEVALFIIDSGEDWSEHFDTDSMADMDCDIDASPYPVLHNIWARQEGEGYGYVLLHFFLEDVGLNQVFITTPAEPAGQHLFGKLLDEGVIELMSSIGDPAYPHRYKIISDPRVNLMRYVEEYMPNSFGAKLRIIDSQFSDEPHRHTFEI